MREHLEDQDGGFVDLVGGQDRRWSTYHVKEAGGEAPTVWSKPEVKKI
jgi:hypothetical protein